MFGLVFAFILFTMPVTALAIDPPAYSDRDSTYSSYQKQVNTLYRNMINGEGQTYTTTDTYTDYYGNTKQVNTTVTTKVLINSPSYYSSPLHKKIDTVADIDRYRLREINAGYADRVNISDYSDTARLTRKSDYGQYLPRDCSSDPSCEVKWVPNIDYSLYTETADNADTVTCPTGSVDPNAPADVQGTQTFLTIFYDQLGTNVLCLHDVSRIYHAYSTNSHVGESEWLAYGSDYKYAETTTHVTKAQRTNFATGYAQWFTTYNQLTGQDVDGYIGKAAASKNAQQIRDEYLGYTGGNGTTITVNIP